MNVVGTQTGEGPATMSKTPKRGTTKEDIPHTAVKYDSGKVRTTLFPTRIYLETCKVFDYGAVKYDVGNWKRGKSFDHSRLIDAFERHIAAVKLGQLHDPDTGKLHVAHAMCCLAMLGELQLTKNGRDDLYERQIHPEPWVLGSGDPITGYITNDYNPPPPAPEKPICMKVSLTPAGSGNGPKRRGNRSRTGKRRPHAKTKSS